MSPFVVKAGRTTCTTCGLRIGNTSADKIEHLTTPSRAHYDSAKRQARDMAVKTGAPICRGCGCTDNCACPEGCWWVIDPRDADGPLCSTCARDAQTTTTEKEAS